MGRAGWQGLGWIAPAQQRDSADGCGVRMISGHGVKWAIELGQGDTFHTHYCDMSSACKVTRGKSEVLVGGSRGRPAAAWLGAGTAPRRRARCGALSAQVLSAHCPRGMGPWRGSGISFLHSAGKHPSQEVPPQESGGLPLSSPQHHCGAARLPLPGLQNATARRQGCCLPRCPSQQISGMVLPSPSPSPSSSDSSGISSTVSGKLMRCLSPTGCGSRAESEKPTPLLTAPPCPG